MKRIFWQAHPARALLEGWLAEAVFLSILLPTMRDAPGIVISMFFVLGSVLCAAVAGLRCRPRTGSHTSVILKEALAALRLAAGSLLITAGLLTAWQASDLPARSHAGLLGAIFFLSLSGPGYLGARAFTWVWERWRQMRRRRFMWALTHAHLTLVAAVGAAGLIAGIIYASQVDASIFTGMPVPSILARITVWLFLLVLLGLLAAAGGILIALPPAALFSAWIARRMTGRLERLTRSTDALRAGDLAVRVPVEGEDEVATLQANFNAMAADLEKSTQALQAERDKVAALLKSQRELTASVSHELRTPISTMAGYLEYLDQHLDERPLAGTRCDLAVVRREADRLNAILNDLFDLSQAEVERLSLNLAPLAVEQVAQRALASVEKLAWETRRIQVTLAVEPGLPCVQADGLRLEQVLLNLLHNSLRHTPPGGVVVLSARREGAAVRLEVADSGEGIAPEDLPRVWEKFYRAASNAPGGAGLGLALVKELVEAMGGSVGVTSVPGSGSCFWVQLPALAEENK